MQIVRGEVRPEVGAVAEDGAVLHEAVAQEDLLTVSDVVTAVDRASARVDGTVGYRRIGLIGAVGEQDQDKEPGEDDQAGHL